MNRMRRVPTIVIGSGLVLVLFLYMVTFQVRETEFAIVTTFGRPGEPIRGSAPGGAGLYGKWPWPIQRVHRYDSRLRHLETPLEQVQTRDGKPIVISSYLLWRIADPLAFHQRVATDARARDLLAALLRSAQNAVLGGHVLADLLAPESEEDRLRRIEAEILGNLAGEARSGYGVEVREAGIQRIGLPERTTQAVFERMRQERERVAAGYRAEGKRRAAEIRADADKERETILAEADRKAKGLRAEGEEAAAKFYETFAQEPELARFLAEIEGVKELAGERTTLIFDLSRPPFDALRRALGLEARARAKSEERGAGERKPAAETKPAAERKPAAETKPAAERKPAAETRPAAGPERAGAGEPGEVPRDPGGGAP